MYILQMYKHGSKAYVEWLRSFHSSRQTIYSKMHTTMCMRTCAHNFTHWTIRMNARAFFRINHWRHMWALAVSSRSTSSVGTRTGDETDLNFLLSIFEREFVKKLNPIVSVRKETGRTRLVLLILLPKLVEESVYFFYFRKTRKYFSAESVFVMCDWDWNRPKMCSRSNLLIFWITLLFYLNGNFIYL